jgi:quercetin dioxygenase-like cupin family protein
MNTGTTFLITVAASVASVFVSLAIAAPSKAVAAPVMVKDLPNVPGMRMTAQTVTYAPGQVSGPHRHAPNGFLIAYVLQGSVNSQVEGEPMQTYTVGQSWTEGPGAHHVVSGNASKTEPASFLVVFVAPKDETLTTPDAK